VKKKSLAVDETKQVIKFYSQQRKTCQKGTVSQELTGNINSISSVQEVVNFRHFLKSTHQKACTEWISRFSTGTLSLQHTENCKKIF
jgi:hypothetical protein